MAAPSLEILFDFETQIATAAAAILASKGFSVHIPGQNESLPDNHCRCSCTTGPATGAKCIIPAGAWAGREEYCQFTATLTVNHSMPFNENVRLTPDALNTVFSSKVAKTRIAFATSAFPFFATNMEYLQVTDIIPQGLHYGTDGYRVGAEMSFQLTFEINLSAWPV